MFTVNPINSIHCTAGGVEEVREPLKNIRRWPPSLGPNPQCIAGIFSSVVSSYIRCIAVVHYIAKSLAMYTIHLLQYYLLGRGDVMYKYIQCIAVLHYIIHSLALWTAHLLQYYLWGSLANGDSIDHWLSSHKNL